MSVLIKLSLTIFILIINISINAAIASDGNGFNIKADNAILIDYNSGVTLYAKNQDQIIAPSSMTKMMTAYVMFDRLKNNEISYNDKLYVSKKAWATGGSKMFVKHNDQVSVSDLIKGMIIQSGNDASIVLAEGIFGNESYCVDVMNRFAAELGMNNTHFVNVNGLPDPNHFSTVHDLALLGIALIRDFPEYYHYHSEKQFTYNDIAQYNKNVLLGDNGVDGIKTGYTSAGKYGIVASAANKDGKRLIAAVSMAQSEKERAEETIKLLNYGFHNFVDKTFFRAGDTIVKVDVAYGDKISIDAITEHDITIPLPRHDLKFNKAKVNSKLHGVIKYDNNIDAPINRGDKIGELVLHYNDDYVSFPLVAKEDVHKANFIHRLARNIHKIVK